MLLQSLVVSLAISAGSAAADPVSAFKALRSQVPELFVAPPLPDMDVDKLPGLPLDVPADASCKTVSGDPLGEGAYLPRAWADALRLQLERGEVYPARAQKRLDELGDLALVAIDAQGQAVRADSAVDVARAGITASPGFWDYVPVGAVALAAGVVIGFLGTVAISR